jgi:hypothetical protein
LLLLLYIVYLLFGWMVAFLFTLAIGIIWASRPLLTPVGTDTSSDKEGFSMKETAIEGHKWFVETVLHENPTKIIEDRVITSAIEGNSPAVTGRTSR